MPHEFDGKKYQKASAHQKEWGMKLIAGLKLKGHEHILDLGCGDGILTAQLAELLPEGGVLGMDASQGMIDVALPKERDNLRFRRLDSNALDIIDPERPQGASRRWSPSFQLCRRRQLFQLLRGGSGSDGTRRVQSVFCRV